MDFDHLQNIAAFAKVARHNSFSAAARDLGLSTATVSRQIARLEQTVGAQLFVRTTRQVALTEIGEAFYRRSSAILLMAEESLSEARELQAEPRGTLRVTAPTLFGNMHLAQMISRFTDQYREVEVRLTVSDGLENISGGDHDVAVRITNHLDDGVVARRLTPINWVVCASPAYIERHGEPRHPHELQGHECCHYASLIRHDRWNFIKDEEEYSAAVHSRLHVNSSVIIASHALAGRAIAMLPTYLVGDYLRSGELRPVLTDYRPTVNSSLYAIYSPTRYLMAKVRCFIDVLSASFADPPYWEAGVAESI